MLWEDMQVEGLYVRRSAEERNREGVRGQFVYMSSKNQ